jgi:hypothetical protein
LAFSLSLSLCLTPTVNETCAVQRRTHEVLGPSTIQLCQTTYRCEGRRERGTRKLHCNYSRYQKHSPLSTCKLTRGAVSLIGPSRTPRHVTQNNPIFKRNAHNTLLCKIWGFHGGDYEEWRLMGRYAVWCCS